MIDPVSIGITVLVSSAPKWFPVFEEALWNKGKERAGEKAKEYVKTVLDQKKHQRHIELALQNAAERGLRQWHTLEERDCYRSILEILSQTESAALRREAMQLFTLDENPDLADLTERYNLPHRIAAMAHHTTHIEVDASPYLTNPMCKFFKQPTVPVEAEEPDLAS